VRYKLGWKLSVVGLAEISSCNWLVVSEGGHVLWWVMEDRLLDWTGVELCVLLMLLCTDTDVL